MDKSIRLGITGSSSFKDYLSLSDWITSQYGIYSIDMIITGNSPGADRLAVKYATEHRIPFVIFRTDRYSGKFAVFQRNVKICDNSTSLIVCGEWDNKYVIHCKDYAYRARLPILPIYSDSEAPG